MKKIALVTGGSRGIGAGIVKKLAASGYRVGINFQSSATAAEAIKIEIEKADGSAFLAPFSVNDPEAVKKAIGEIIAKEGPIAVLVNNAGVNADALLLRAKNEDIDRILDINLKGAIYCTREVVSSMMKQRTGSVIHISSVVGESGNAGQSVYSATKAGLIGFSKSVAKELASRGVRSNVVTPGYIATEMTGALTDTQKEAILRNIPLGQFGTTEDIANAVDFLAGEQSRYITGQVIAVNGGLYI